MFGQYFDACTYDCAWLKIDVTLGKPRRSNSNEAIAFSAHPFSPGAEPYQVINISLALVVLCYCMYILHMYMGSVLSRGKSNQYGAPTDRVTTYVKRAGDSLVQPD